MIYFKMYPPQEFDIAGLLDKDYPMIKRKGFAVGDIFKTESGSFSIIKRVWEKDDLTYYLVEEK